MSNYWLDDQMRLDSDLNHEELFRINLNRHDINNLFVGTTEVRICEGELVKLFDKLFFYESLPDKMSEDALKPYILTEPTKRLFNHCKKAMGGVRSTYIVRVKGQLYDVQITYENKTKLFCFEKTVLDEYFYPGGN